MADLVETVGLADTFTTAGLEVGDIESAYGALLGSDQHARLAREFEHRIREYLGAVELPEEPTAYDYLLLGLRPNDLIATFNWDPLLTQAYRRNRRVAPLPQLVFLHGMVDLGYCFEHRRYGPIGEGCDTCRQPLVETSILYPVADKNYTADAFLALQWGNLRSKLARAYIVTVFGYSAPRTDVAARAMLLEAWRQNGAKDLAEINIIDTKETHELLRSWDEFIVRSHYGTHPTFDRSLIAWHRRRSCEALFMATLMNTPWPDNWYPAFDSIAALQEWIQPLVEEERALAGAGSFAGSPCPVPSPARSAEDRHAG